MNSKDYLQLKPFIGNKKEGQGFADKRKRKAAYDYLKFLKKEKCADRKKFAQQKTSDIFCTLKRFNDKNPHRYSSAEKIAKKKKEEKNKQVEVKKQKFLDKSAAMSSYVFHKKQNHLKLCKRTRKGQPVMKYQMEVLLEKIKKQRTS
ncbi:thyroid transcription factor 1-associated protein 26 homolog [Physella acuta]|uniref:thyroid transcription factor 1-associated protein 26 homolog n=1 Tax=Physella acuta TaxID=109671 RepID=UPI0027DD040F|nr:thyroid transcription factor 1-associated protein 26 homolog [Physella acuta]